MLSRRPFYHTSSRQVHYTMHFSGRKKARVQGRHSRNDHELHLKVITRGLMGDREVSLSLKARTLRSPQSALHSRDLRPEGKQVEDRPGGDSLLWLLSPPFHQSTLRRTSIWRTLGLLISSASGPRSFGLLPVPMER